jgi:hypothetical protein
VRRDGRSRARNDFDTDVKLRFSPELLEFGDESYVSPHDL